MYGKIVDYTRYNGVMLKVVCPVCKSEYLIKPSTMVHADPEETALITVGCPHWDTEHSYISVHMDCKCCGVSFHSTMKTDTEIDIYTDTEINVRRLNGEDCKEDE